MTLEINIPEVVSEVREAFESYEAALVTNDVVTLDELFWRSPHAVRYGVTESLYGWDDIASFRAARSSGGLEREVLRTVITTYGREFATASIEFRRRDSGRTGRQSQTWVRLPEGWRVALGHVSILEAP